MNTLKRKNMMAAYTGFKGHHTMSHIGKLVGSELAQILTGKQLGMVMDAVNRAYQEGKASTGAEMIDCNAVYINNLDKVIEWNEIGAEYEPVTTVENGLKVTRWVKIKEGELITQFA